MPTDSEKEIIKEFLKPYFGPDFVPVRVARADQRTIDEVTTFVASQFSRMRYVLGLALDFTLVAQHLSLHDATAKAHRPGLTKDELFTRYEQRTSHAGRTSNTLTLKYQDQSIGIRKIEEGVVDLFMRLKRPGYPSAYVYNTGQWHKFQDSLLVPCFSPSESGRHHLATALIQFGLDNLKGSAYLGRDTPRVRIFPLIMERYPRTQAGENSGSAFQGMAYGFMKADRPHLSLVVDKTRTGSARQGRIGDIDGYFGLDLEVTVEVKDRPLTDDNVSKELGEFLAKVSANKVQGLAFVSSATDAAVEEVEKHGVNCLTLTDVLHIVARWDWRKQDAAVQGVLHFLAHIEQDPDAVDRLLGFIAEHDPDHDALAYLDDETDDPSS